jgi:hypothetical protein
VAAEVSVRCPRGTRLEVLPNLPTVGDFLPGYEAGGWQGIGAPKNTPVEFIDKLNKEIRVGLTDPKIMSRITDLGGVALASSRTFHQFRSGWLCYFCYSSRVTLKTVRGFETRSTNSAADRSALFAAPSRCGPPCADPVLPRRHGPHSALGF